MGIIVEIRNRKSTRVTKPRVFDAVIQDDGEVILKIKAKKIDEEIELNEVLNQINEAIGK